jgi:hypothetical protein
MADRQCSELFGLTTEERIGAYDERTDLLLVECDEGVINFRFGTRAQDFKLRPECCGRFL